MEVTEPSSGLPIRRVSARPIFQARGGAAGAPSGPYGWVSGNA